MSFYYRGEKRALVELPGVGWGDGKTYGAAIVRGPCGRNLAVIFSDGQDWEHVSVSLEKRMRIPNWQEMCYIKDLFWDEEDCVVQYHPPKSQYVNCCPNCLHLWRTIMEVMPTPDPNLVGPS